MRIYDIIDKKKKGLALTDTEIYEFVRCYTDGEAYDYQAAALLMAICINGMNYGETRALTDAIMRSGDTVDLSEFGSLTADKHSTGGVGDKTTLIVAPIAAAAGCIVAKMSGRGLGHTGGTVDKLEAIPGYNSAMSAEQFKRQVSEIGIAVVSQGGNLAPADKKLYALRDVTATVDSIPLITSSVMGKKLAAGSHTIVLDVKCGSGAFVKTPHEARRLAENMVKIGTMCGRRVAALITDMDVPLGRAIGNAAEVREAIATLKGNGPDDLTEISLALAATMISLTHGISERDAAARARELLYGGAALEKFKQWISAQGGDTAIIDEPALLPTAKFKRTLYSNRAGFISKMDAEKIGLAAMELGAGRKSKDDAIDYSAAITLLKKTGDAVKRGDALAVLEANDEGRLDEAERIFLSSAEILDRGRERGALILDKII